MKRWKPSRKLFAEAGLPYRAEILYGRNAAKARKIPYGPQFVWQPDVPVRIISHAHLAVLLGEQASGRSWNFARQADVVVVDEDPLFSLLASEPEGKTPARLTLAWLSAVVAKGQGGNLPGALMKVVQAALRGETPAPLRTEHPISETVQLSLTGQGFWTALLEALDGQIPNWSALSVLLARLKLNIPKDVMVAFGEDYRQALHGNAGSYRFGLAWKEGKPASLHLRFDVLRRFKLDSPGILILDAYAQEPGPSNGYQLAFPGHRVQVVRNWPMVPLVIEAAPELEINRLNLQLHRQDNFKNYLLSETRRLAEHHHAGALILSYQSVIQALQLEESDLIRTHYWFAGRGLNTFRGRQVVAWHAPARPSLFEHHQLAALAPRDREVRRALARHLRDTELLQMLHRGRQTSFAPGDPQRPRVVTFFEPDIKNPDWATVVPYKPFRSFKTWSKNPHWQPALRTISEELLARFGAVPHAALCVLGLCDDVSDEELLGRVRAAVRRQARHAKKKAPMLSAWRENPDALQSKLGPFEPAYNGQHKRLLQEMGLDLRQISLRGPAGQKVLFYAADEQSAKAALKLLFMS